MWGYGMEVYCETESKGWQFKRTPRVNAAWGYKVVMWIRAVQQGFKTWSKVSLHNESYGIVKIKLVKCSVYGN